MSWIEDGIEEPEITARYGISYLSSVDPELARTVFSLEWVQDGITHEKALTIVNIAMIARQDPEAALRIARMPFLETFESPNRAATCSLSRLADVAPETFNAVLSHPVLQRGITGKLTPIVATLAGVAETNPSLVNDLLDPNIVDIEWRTATLPLSGAVVLTITRTAPGAGRSMDLLEHAVRSAEAYLDAPLPTNYVGLLFDDVVPGSAGGRNFGDFIAIRAEADVDDESWRADRAGPIIAHEVSHHYWFGNTRWIAEGAVRIMAAIIDSARTGRPPAVTSPPCAHAGSISELESRGFLRGDAGFDCDYSLGERLFMDLYRTLGAREFQLGFRELYLTSKMEEEADENSGTSLGINHVMAAFRSDDGAADAVIARWYDGAGAYDLSHVDRSQVDVELPRINGLVKDAYLAAGKDGPRVSTFSSQGIGEDLFIAIDVAFSVSDRQDLPVEIVEHYQDGFDFNHVRLTLPTYPGPAGTVIWASVGREPNELWAPGHYAVFVYAGGKKVAEVYYEVTP